MAKNTEHQKSFTKDGLIQKIIIVTDELLHAKGGESFSEEWAYKGSLINERQDLRWQLTGKYDIEGEEALQQILGLKYKKPRMDCMILERSEQAIRFGKFHNG